MGSQALGQATIMVRTTISNLANRNDENDYLDFERTHQDSTASAHELTPVEE